MSGSEIANWTVEEFREHVQQGIDRLRKGELYTAYGLNEDETILEEADAPPPRSDKKHPYNKLMEDISVNIVKNYALEKKAKKQIIKHLQAFNDDWAALIRNDGVVKTEEGDDKKNAPDDTKERKSTAKVEKATEAPTEGEAAVRLEEILDETAAPAAYTERQLEEKAQFESERDSILKDVPGNVKERFGKIFFTKWSNQLLPCLVMNPFDVPPGPARDVWYTMYDKVSYAIRVQGRH
jgi:hypothetical protein